jgi:hypothetical protein
VAFAKSETIGRQRKIFEKIDRSYKQQKKMCFINIMKDKYFLFFDIGVWFGEVSATVSTCLSIIHITTRQFLMQLVNGAAQFTFRGRG